MTYYDVVFHQCGTERHSHGSVRCSPFLQGPPEDDDDGDDDDDESDDGDDEMYLMFVVSRHGLFPYLAMLSQLCSYGQTVSCLFG